MNRRLSVRNAAHLARRLAGSLSRRPPDAAETHWALGFLLPREGALWSSMSPADRRHSVIVARNFIELEPSCSPQEVAAALLHDVGKSESALGTWGRVLATVVGPRTARFRAYHDHERIGLRMLCEAGSDAATVALLDGSGERHSSLRAADHV